MDRGLKMREDASNSLAEPFLFSTMYLGPHLRTESGMCTQCSLLCPGLVSCASNRTAVPHPEQKPTLSTYK